MYSIAKCLTLIISIARRTKSESPDYFYFIYSLRRCANPHLHKTSTSDDRKGTLLFTFDTIICRISLTTFCHHHLRHFSPITTPRRVSIFTFHISDGTNSITEQPDKRQTGERGHGGQGAYAYGRRSAVN